MVWLAALQQQTANTTLLVQPLMHALLYVALLTSTTLLLLLFLQVFAMRCSDKVVRAAKVVSLEGLTDAQLQTVYLRFARELYILSSLKSERVVAVHGAATSCTQLALVMEYMRRGSLRGILDSGTFLRTFVQNAPLLRKFCARIHLYALHIYYGVCTDFKVEVYIVVAVECQSVFMLWLRIDAAPSACSTVNTDVVLMRFCVCMCV
jgi:Protein tyrosine and serine/threonine kinase